MTDVLIIGCGVTGAATAYELSKYDLSVTVLERFNDVANGATKANSAILHAGFDPIPGTKMARMNIMGIKMAKEICEKLDVERREIPSFVVAFNEADRKEVARLYRQGVENGCEGLEIIDGKEAVRREPNLNPEIIEALYAPHSAIVNPWEYAIAMAETAAKNGVKFYLSHEVTALTPIDGGVRVTTNHGDFEAKYIINAAGCFSADICRMAGDNRLTQTNSCGEYYVLDKIEGGRVNSVVFPCPDETGKGILVAPTVHGNLITGPDSFKVANGDYVGTKAELLEVLKNKARRLVPSVNFREIIHEYAGVRPNTLVDEFIIDVCPTMPRLINLAGIKSPGLSAAPAIALEGVELLEKSGLELKKKTDYKDGRKRIKFRELNEEERRKVVAQNPLYGRIICRCETVTEGEIVEAIHRPIVPRSIDAIKRRCNAGMGRCQGGFCSPRVHEILARELGVSPLDIQMDEDGSYILTGRTKEGNGNA